jgi:hypothetical protein
VRRDEAFPNTGRSEHLTFPKPIYKVRARAGKELLFYSEDLVPSHRVADCTAEARGLERLAQVLSGDIMTPVIGVFRGLPIDVCHFHEIGALRDGSKYCINSVSEPSI